VATEDFIDVEEARLFQVRMDEFKIHKWDASMFEYKYLRNNEKPVQDDLYNTINSDSMSASF
jgi:hypothetical protein